MINRRQFLKSLGLAAGTLALPGMLRAASSYHVVVVGGGFAGATAARYLKHWAPALKVTLIEPNPIYHFCILW